MKDPEILGTNSRNCQSTPALIVQVLKAQGAEIRLGKATQIANVMRWGVPSRTQFASCPGPAA